MRYVTVYHRHLSSVVLACTYAEMNPRHPTRKLCCFVHCLSASVRRLVTVNFATRLLLLFRENGMMFIVKIQSPAQFPPLFTRIQHPPPSATTLLTVCFPLFSLIFCTLPGRHSPRFESRVSYQVGLCYDRTTYLWFHAFVSGRALYTPLQFHLLSSLSASLYPL